MKTHWQDVSIPISRNSPAKVLHSQPGILQVFLEMAMFFYSIRFSLNRNSERIPQTNPSLPYVWKRL